MRGLALRELRKNYGRVLAHDEVTLDVSPGEFMVLLGPSGCGKSTLLGVIAGLEEATAGTVAIGGRDVARLEPRDRDVAMVFQSYALYPTMSARRNMGFGLRMRGMPAAEVDRKVERAARLLQIEALLDRKPSELSGGQRQRVAIGRAIVRDPSVLLMDEPLSNLDAKLRGEMRAEIKRLHGELGTTVVYVTHDQTEAMTLATRIALMKDGRIQQVGTPEEIYSRPQSLFVAEFVGSPGINLLPATLARRDGRFFAAHGRWLLPLDAYPFATAPEEGRPIVLGIRPEDVGEETNAGTAIAEMAVVRIELTGPDTYLRLRAEDAELTGRIPSGHCRHVGDSVAIRVTTERASVFCSRSGLRL